MIGEQSAYGDFQIQQSTTQTGSTYANILYFSPTGAATFSSSIAVLSTGITVTIDDAGKSGYTITNSAAARTYKMIAGIDGTSNTGFSIRNITAGRNELSFTDAGAATFSSSLTTSATINSGDSVTLLGELYWGGTISGQKVRAYTSGASGSATLNFSFWNGSAWGIQGSLTSAGVWSTTGGGTSDARTKEEIDYNFDNGIESILKLQPTKIVTGKQNVQVSLKKSLRTTQEQIGQR